MKMGSHCDCRSHFFFQMMCPKSVQIFGHISDILQMSKICLTCVQNVSKLMSKMCPKMRPKCVQSLDISRLSLSIECVQMLGQILDILQDDFRALKSVKKVSKR